MSKTIIGILIAVLGPKMAELGIPDEAVAKIVEWLIGAAGGALAWYGRKTASGEITWLGTRAVKQEAQQ